MDSSSLPSVGNVPPPASEDDPVGKALTGELVRVQELLAASNVSTATVLQNIIIIFAGGILAADKYPAITIAIPLFWTVWMMHALMNDRDTVKHAAYAHWLERRLNLLLGERVYGWETLMADRSNERPFLFQVSYVYWGLLNLSSWILGIVVVARTQSVWWTGLALTVGLALWGSTVYSVATRERFRKKYVALLEQLEPDSLEGRTAKSPAQEGRVA